MAKVEIEDRAFNEPRLKQASARFRVSRVEIMGYATILWNQSQQIGIEHATGQEIISWLDVDRFSKPVKAIKWLVAAEFLDCSIPLADIISFKKRSDFDKISFKIRGNSVAILKTKKRIENARKAISARYQKDSSYETYTPSTTPSTTSRIPNNIQLDSKTVRQEDRETRKKEETKTVSSELVFENKKPTSLKNNQPTHGALIWSAYSAAYRQRYGIEPKRNATTSAQCSQLVKRLGVKDAIEVVGFYLGHNSDWYIKCSHSIGQCLKDSESLYSQMMRGEKITTARARQIDSGSEQAEIFERVTRRLEEKYEGKKS